MEIGQFVRICDGRVGVVIATERSGGVFRGHCNIWFGDMYGGQPKSEHLLVKEEWEPISSPIGT